MNNMKTGGPDYIPPDDILEKVAALLGNAVDSFTVSYGGDAEFEPESCASANDFGGQKRKIPKSDENRSARNEALAKYYTTKTKLLEANFENVLLENIKLNLEIQKLQEK